MGGKQILLVESDQSLSRSTADFLLSHHYGLDIAYNGNDALRRLEHLPDLVLIAHLLPDMQGIDICQKIRDDERLCHIPIILLTDSDVSAEEMESLHIYGDDHIVKPFDCEELLARIEVILRRHQVSRQALEEKNVVTQELKKILKNELIVPFFQPIYSMRTLKPLGVEALSRPTTDTFLRNPELFFKAALTFGMYSEVERLAWRKAFRYWKEHIGEGKLFLNCTPHFIGNNPMDESFFAGLGMDPQRIVLELTERTAISNRPVFIGKINDLRYLGAQIAVDDVGSGFASLDTVADVRPDYVKIDLSLVCDIHFDSLKKNIVQSIISFCRKSDILTVAEGIEKPEELKVVRELDIDAVQGFLLAKPAPEIDKSIFSKALDL